jgi:cysteinyl-tRNA synthetase
MMGEIFVDNSFTGKKEPLIPLRNGQIRMYVCGVTVYDRAHLGHARSALIFDLIYRFLRRRGYDVVYAKNYTDVDDKIIERARKEGRSWKEIAETYIVSYRNEMARLNILPPTLEPRATEHIPEMIEMTRRLIDRGYAYVLDGDVYFEVGRFPAYGRLSGRRLDELQAGARVEVDERKRSPLDFALWKGAKPDEPSWESPWGFGRPGWHIECSAMAIRHLGETLDIHGGGQDLIFPHHENEIAQSEAATGKPFARLWVHNGFVTINREKMSKSLGNFFTVEEVFEKSRGLLGTRNDRKISEVLRYLLLSVHYRSPIDFSVESLREAKAALDNFYLMFFDLEKRVGGTGDGAFGPLLERTGEEVDRALEDDFNAPEAFGKLQLLRGEINKRSARLSRGEAEEILRFFRGAMGDLFGLFQCDPEREWGIVDVTATSTVNYEIVDKTTQEKIKDRDRARRNKDWERADRIRRELAEAGIILEDRPGGVTRVIVG